MVLVRIAVAIAIVAVGARPARACSQVAGIEAPTAPDVFTWYELADSVAEVEVASAPGFTTEGHGEKGDVVLTVRAALKGKPGGKIVFVQDPTPCGGQSKGVVEIGFFDAKHHPFGFAAKTTKDAIVAWSRAAAVDRLALLAKLATSADPFVAGAAAKRLRTIWGAKPQHWKAPGTAALAAARARDVWPALVAAAPKDALAPFASCKLEAVKQTCAAVRARIVDVEGAHPKLALGTVDELGAGDCWDASCGVGFHTLVVIVAADGRIVVVWLVPEG